MTGTVFNSQPGMALVRLDQDGFVVVRANDQIGVVHGQRVRVERNGQVGVGLYLGLVTEWGVAELLS